MAEALNEDHIRQALAELPGWTEQSGAIEKTFAMADYYRTIAFVNAIAWIAHRADHHPDLLVGYNKVTVRYSTHSAGGITEKDLASAREVEHLGAD
jgi:4a-hydroxytetrahydrobiopterin dehydratase